MNKLDNISSAELSLEGGCFNEAIEKYFELGWTDGLPKKSLVTKEKIDKFVEFLDGNPDFIECKVPPRWGGLSRGVLAINMIMAGCKAEYAPVVRAAILALTDSRFNLNGVQATTHMKVKTINNCKRSDCQRIGMNGGANALGLVIEQMQLLEEQ